MDFLQYSFKGLAEGKMTAWLNTAFTTCKVVSMSLKALLQGLFFPPFLCIVYVKMNLQIG